ncbi:MAG: GHMP kinase [Acidobacteria bacterium]|nr:MAG: GHMP kinase [Acidobacteriota bacterium]PYV05818.1 MAG: GHMP kinase [Acidobacteriota bacterium]PYV30907.1 MAG: GHMP kinase [Acidobacteriota bacterium]
MKTLSSALVVTRTPLRVSFAGGGTDLSDFYEHGHGTVFSTTIDKYIYVTVKRHGPVFDEQIRLNYSKSEQVNRIDEIENDIARECLRFLEIEPPIYVSTVADLPASTGLGGSSSFAVGLLNALHAFRGERVSAGQLAEEASYIEIDVLRQPIGKQDQYAAAFGGLNSFCFKAGGGVTVEPQRLANGALAGLFGNIMMFWTGHQRDSSSVLAEQKSNTSKKMESLLKMREHACQLQALTCNGRFDVTKFGRILDEGWQLKRQLATTITNNQIDAWYHAAIAAGAEGGKLCGAGGGGFLLFLAKPERREAVRQALNGLTEVSVAYEAHGSYVLLSTV